MNYITMWTGFVCLDLILFWSLHPFIYPELIKRYPDLSDRKLGFLYVTAIILMSLFGPITLIVILRK